MDMSTGIPMSLLEMMEISGNDGAGFGAQSTSNLGGRNQPWEMASNASEAVMPTTAVTANAATHPGGVMVDTDESTNQPGRNRQHRYTDEQIQELETFFKACPYPDENQRNDLGRSLELESNQVKFWFQNKRTKLKALNEHEYNLQLHKENEKLQRENLQYKIALAAVYCRQCGVPCINGFLVEEHQLKLENARLRNEIDRIATSIATRFAMISSLPIQNEVPSEVSFTTMIPPFQGVKIYGNNGEITRILEGPLGVEKPIITKLALSAMDELLQMTQLKEPLWVPSGNPNTTFVLNKEIYGRLCSRGSSAIIANPNAGFKTEASRESAWLKMNPIQLVDAFMNVDRWATMFSNIVSRAVTVGVISIGAAGNYDGALQVIYAEFKIPTPQVALRNYYFARHCKKIIEGTWAIVDFSIDRYLCVNQVDRCLRRPSGCLIQEVPNGSTKVTWVEHIEIDNDDNEAISIYKALLDSGMAFGAKRWVSTLQQRCQHPTSAISIIIPPAIENLVITPDGKKGTLKLVERMVNNYMSVVSCSVPLKWKVLSRIGAGADDVRIMTRKVLNEPGIPSGVHLSAATSFWLPLEPKRVFDFLNDNHQRAKWDIFSYSCALQEVARIIYGREIENCVSLFKVANPSMTNTMMLQESSTSSTGSYIIYAPVETTDMKLVSQGGDSKEIPLLSCGFIILPDGRPPETGSSDGSLVTIAFQLLVDSIPTTKLSPESVTMIDQLTIETVEKITTCLF